MTWPTIILSSVLLIAGFIALVSYGIGKASKNFEEDYDN